jgi:Peptidase family M28
VKVRRTILIAVACVGLIAPSGSHATAPTAYDHLRAILARSRAPEYRRAGSRGMRAVAAYTAATFRAAGYRVVRYDFPFTRYVIDYRRGRRPMLMRDDGTSFKTESAFDLDLTTSRAGITCRVKMVSDVKRGDCGFIPFGEASPEWKNSPFVDYPSQLDAIIAAHGAGAIIQGDTKRDLVFALRARRKLPTVIAVADASELVGRTVRLRAVGHYVTAVGHDTVAIRRPPPGSGSYVMLLAHGDGWFQAGADNGSGAAAVLRAAEVLAGRHLNAGLIAVVTDAEEIGLIGADRLAEAFDAGFAVGDGKPPIHIGDINAIVNLDACSARASDVQDTVLGIARRDAPLFSWRAMVSSEEPALTGPFLARFAAHQVLGAPVPAAVFKPVAAGSLTGRQRTDVGPFEERGIPFAWPVVGYPEYHTDGDTLAAVDPVDLENVALAAADLVGDLALILLPRVPAPLR